MKHGEIDAKRMPPAKTKKQSRREKAKVNSTPGSQKGAACMAEAIDKGFCFYNRSWKQREYPGWRDKMQAKFEKYK